jgi:Ca2+-binding RTX toxin-like protein
VATRGTFTGLISQNTITINAGEGHVMVDLSQMTSDEHVVVNSGGTYQIVDGDGRNLTVNGGTPSNENAAPTGTETGTSETGNGNTNETVQQGDVSADSTPDASGDEDAGNDDNAVSDDGTSGNPVSATDTAVTNTADANHIGLTLTGDGNANTLIGSDDSDLMFGGDGADNIVGAGGSDMLFGDGGNDRIFGGEGHDVIDGGAGNDIVFAGDGNDLIIAEANDGSDTYWGEAGTDTLDYAAVSANIEVDLGSGLLGRGQVVIGAETDTIYGFENVITGAGNDRIIANASVNAMDGGAGNDTFVFSSVEAANGDTIFNFAPGDKIDLSGIDADHGAAGQQSFVLFATGSFSAAGQLMVTFETHEDGEHTIISGNVDDDTEADFSIDLVGRHLLTGSDFSGVN